MTLAGFPMVLRRRQQQTNVVTSAQSNPAISELLEVRASAVPTSAAVVAGDRTLSYGDMKIEADRVARGLAARGIGPGAIVGVCLERNADLIPALLGVLRAGAAYLPIDPFYPRERVRLMLEDASPHMVLHSESHRGMFAGMNVSAMAVEHIDSRHPVPPVVSAPEDLAYVIYTSGSTGIPKGVMIQHRGLSNLMLAAAELFEARPSDRLLAVSTISFDIAAVELFMPLLTGGTVILATREEAMDGRALARLIERHEATLMQATPATWRMLIEGGWKGRRGLRAITGGEALTRRLADALMDRVDTLWNGYGPTETTIYSVVHRVERVEDPVPIGRAVPGTTLHLLDEALNAASQGELCIGGLGLARGYLNRPELTDERFIADPAGSGERLYRTGDLCRWRDDGVLEYIGRRDHQVKIRGYRVELGEVEAVLSQDPDVREAVVGVREKGESKSLVAYITPKDGASPTLTSLRRRAGDRLPAHMLPTALVVVDRMPLTPAGKTDRAALIRLNGHAVTHVPVAPATATEHMGDFEAALLSAFRTVLGDDQLSLDDDFFDAGGHSLLAFSAALEIERGTGRTVDVALIFKHPTARALAGALQRNGGATVPATVIDLQPLGEPPPFLCVCGVAVYLPLAKALAPHQPVSAIYVETDLDVFHGRGHNPGALTVEDIADRYYEQIRVRRPQGPYRLMGFSMGGAVAFEVARRLIAAGQEVDLVTMIDTVLAHSQPIRPRVLASLFFHRLMTRGPAYVVRRTIETLDPERARAVKNDNPSATELGLLVEARSAVILREYQPRPCPVEVLLFNAADRPRATYRTYDETGGWGSAVERLTVKMVPGDHRDLLSDPSAAASIAATIRQHLAETRPRAGRPLGRAAGV
jgi:amino acid adenylation domain-containing protein